MPYRKGDEPSTWTLCGVEIPYQDGDITEEEFQAWREANDPPGDGS